MLNYNPALIAVGNTDSTAPPSSASLFMGIYTDIDQLQTAHPAADAGSYAYIDTGVGNDAVPYIFDSDDAKWVEGGGTGSLPEDVMTKAVYDTNNSGKVDDAEKVNNLTVETAVPVDAKFTDTLYDKDIETLSNTVLGINALNNKLLIYYGYPIAYQNLWSVSAVIDAIAINYDVYVVGEGYEDPTHEQYATTQDIIVGLQARGVTCVGYVAIGGDTGANSTEAEIAVMIANWKTLGVIDIFLDEFGFDYHTTREKQIYCVGLVKANGGFYIANANQFPDISCDTLAELPTTGGWESDGTGWKYSLWDTYNPNELALPRDNKDWSIIEGFALKETGYSDVFSLAENVIDFIHPYNKDDMIIYGVTLAKEANTNTIDATIETSQYGDDSLEKIIEFAYASAYALGLDGCSICSAVFGSGGYPLTLGVLELPEPLQRVTNDTTVMAFDVNGFHSGYTDGYNILVDINDHTWSYDVKTVNNQFAMPKDTASTTDPAGNDTEVQFNDGGIFGAISDFVYDKVNKVLSIFNLKVSNNIDLPHTATDETALTKDGLPWLHDYSHPTGDTVQPTGYNVVLGKENANTTMGSTATSYWEGSYNTFVGSRNATAMEAGYHNALYGYRNSPYITDGSYNTIVGDNNLIANTIGTRNTIMGTNNVSAADNPRFTVALGYNLIPVTAVTYNSILVGNNIKSTASGADIAEADLCILIGNDISTSYTGAYNEIVIGNSVSGHGINTVTLGSDAVVGTYLHGDIHTTNNIEMPHTGDADTGIIVKDDSPWLHDYSHPTGDTAKPAGYNICLGVGVGNTSMGYTATSTLQASYNNFIGRNVFPLNNLGYQNTGIGESIGSNVNYPRYANVVGSSLLTNVTSLYKCSVLGSDIANTSGGNPVTYVEQGIFIGNAIYPGATTSVNEIIIGNSTVGHGSKTVTIGNDNIESNHFYGDMKLQAGDYECTTAGNGIVLTSPDGLITKKITIDNSGALSVIDI